MKEEITKETINPQIIFLTFISGIILLLILIIAFLFFSNSDNSEMISQEEVHLHAGFIVIKDEEVQNFDNIKYMHFGTCGEEHYAQDLPPELEQLERAHLHDLVGNVVHVHRDGATWSDLFENINYTFDGEVSGYINGEIVEDILTSEIKSMDQVMIFDGIDGEYDSFVDQIPSIERIIEVENTAESCSA